ncbi:cysteine-rich receptor-like protein kinase 25 isoform X1 [Jatropha curcas]|uniref:cysteine-rich receptor-like protein kinase 25 isoform X1 n=1 Tax=Jatropha curcas TaxID=180498 RepID=UPI0009D72406|nr:cysteine-rich receptor-like protein kinase 25 isoform X1 [Jatropha curcas]
MIMWRLTVLLCMLSLLSNRIIEATKNPVNVTCFGTSTFTPNSTYKASLDLVFSSLLSNITSKNYFYKYSAGHSSNDVVYGSFLCRGDLTTGKCKACVDNATQDMTRICSSHKESIIWYDQCMVRYSNKNFFNRMELEPHVIGTNAENTQEPNFIVKLQDIMNHLVSAMVRHYQSSAKKFATKMVKYKPFPIYSLADCTPDISAVDCSICLKKAISYLPNCCSEKIGGRILLPSCSIRYENYPFYRSQEGGHGHHAVWLRVTAAVVCSVFNMVVFSIVFCFFRRKRLKKRSSRIDELLDRSKFSNIESLQFSLSTVKAATNNFSPDNKLGEGGFGAVYKGTLPNGQEIAAKRLSKCSGQGAEEFKNEIESVTKLQHRNLVRLLGLCFEGEEKILVYEFVPNRSLDYILFDAGKKDQLDWSRRYKIIVGIARGLLYLHEDSRLRIIHRDLKASNVLLDGDMNPRISDFGTARIFGVDQIEGSTKRIVGTYGYMSPEYVTFGNFSVKSDVFSFGVLVLEIISSKRNSSSKIECGRGLLDTAWRQWSQGTPVELMDPALKESCSVNEVIRGVHIGLLCVQEDMEDRPTMARVVAMLTSDTTSLPMPQQPAFTNSSGIQSHASCSTSSNQL